MGTTCDFLEGFARFCYNDGARIVGASHNSTMGICSPVPEWLAKPPLKREKDPAKGK
jgi:hypothetical protein